MQENTVAQPGIAVSSSYFDYLTKLKKAFIGYLDRNPALFVILFSCSYLAMMLYRAHRKSFWFDELYTLYLSRIPDLPTLWKALTSGIDFNPPLFYTLTRFAGMLFGDGEIATRMPEIIGLWVFCISLYIYVSRIASPLAGMVSMLTPLVTVATYYGYEARPYGIVLGFTGLALVCWQAAGQEPRRLWPVGGLACALAAAVLTHSYGTLIFFPLAFGEVIRSFRLRRINWRVWAAFAFGALPVITLLPLLRAAKVHMGTVFLPPSFRRLAETYRSQFGPAVSVLVVVLTGMGVLELLSGDDRQKKCK